MSRTLHLTSPLMHGPDVIALQTMLRAHGWFTGQIDGDYGPLTAQAVHRAKYWLGYPAEKVDQNAGGFLVGFLSGKPTSRDMAARMKERMAAKPKVPKRVQALHLLSGKLGVKEAPAGSNRCWATQWYGIVGPWCAMSVSWAYAMAGSTAFHAGSRYAFVPFILNDAHAGTNHLTLTNDPEEGDLVIYDWQHDGVADHVGLFQDWAPGGRRELVAVEGNTSSDAAGDQSNGGEVCRKHRDRSLVKAFVRVGA